MLVYQSVLGFILPKNGGGGNSLGRCFLEAPVTRAWRPSGAKSDVPCQIALTQTGGAVEMTSPEDLANDIARRCCGNEQLTLKNRIFVAIAVSKFPVSRSKAVCFTISTQNIALTTLKCLKTRFRRHMGLPISCLAFQHHDCFNR